MKIKDQERLMKAVADVLAVSPAPFSLGEGIDALYGNAMYGLRPALIALAFTYSEIENARYL